MNNRGNAIKCHSLISTAVSTDSLSRVIWIVHSPPVFDVHVLDDVANILQIKHLDEQLIHGAYFWSGIHPVLYEHRGECPALETTQDTNDASCAVLAGITM